MTQKTPRWLSQQTNHKEIQEEGALYDTIRGAIAKHAGEDAAKTIVAAAAFEVTETRGLIDWQG